MHLAYCKLWLFHDDTGVKSYTTYGKVYSLEDLTVPVEQPGIHKMFLDCEKNVSYSQLSN